ncbi:hypothetical protein [Burkholderia cenocepacia]|uniref:hypothetical protein n=1 Tax=Burkholderia cenocepacia TaxID=95486 RepID=UPI002231B836|nr:hypothetical protein [Burkholderia cenocepacia]
MIDSVLVKASNSLTVPIEGFSRISALLYVAEHIVKQSNVERCLATLLAEAILIADEYEDRASEDKRTFDELRGEVRHG